MAISTESLQFELIDIDGMLKTLQHVDESIKEKEETLHRQRRRVFRQIRRANRAADDISEQVETVREIGSQLNDLNDKLKAIGQRNDILKPDFSSVPNVRVPVYLDFSNQDTVEGKLKATLLECEDRTTCNAENVYAPITAIVGVAGMGGVGKTTAMIGLARDADVREKFSRGGIYFVVVGKDATPGSLVARLKEIVRRSGGKKRCEEIDNNGSLEAAVGTASSWFAGRKALFLLDDLWQTTFSHTGYFEVLTEILGNSLASHVVISTRSNIIACETSTRIEFEPRENTGREARGMFLANAGLDEKMIQDDDCEEIVEKVLKLCGGVPLMLSIAGAQVRQRTGTPKVSLERLSYILLMQNV